MVALIERLQKDGGGRATREDARTIAKQAKAKAAKGRPRHYVFRYQPREKSFALSLQFRKSEVPREEIVTRAAGDHRGPAQRRGVGPRPRAPSPP